MSWHRTYRPRQIKDLHLTSVRNTLLGLMAEGKIPQALLFAGPKGTGKTSASRILAAVLNDEQNIQAVESIYLGGESSAKTRRLLEPNPNSPLTKRICAGQSFAVQEIDAASHGLVDDVRLLKERASLIPQEGKMAVYILDEAHMMSTAAFNAFLKLLEEPPAHAIFILATTELHKIPATIASRCLLVQFRKASDDELKTTLQAILKLEKVSHTTEQLERLIRAADGSFRDAVKLTELSVDNGKITDERLEQLTGGSYEQLLKQLIEAVVDKQAIQVLHLLGKLREAQADVNQVHKSLFSMLHQDLLRGYGVSEGEKTYTPAINLFLIQQLLAAQLQQPSPIPFLPLEIALLDIVARAKQRETNQTSSVSRPQVRKQTLQPPTQPMASPQEEDEDEQLGNSFDVAAGQLQTHPEQANAVVIAQVEVPTSDPIKPHRETIVEPGDLKQLVEKWQDFVAAVAVKNSGLAALLRSSTPEITNDQRIMIGVYYRFHQEQLQQPKFLTILEACCAEIVGSVMPFRFQLAQQPADSQSIQSDAMVIAAAQNNVSGNSGARSLSTQTNTLAAIASEVLL